MRNKMSKYNFNFAVSAKIDAKTVEDMIKAVVEEQTGRKVISVDINVKMKSQGFQRDEYQVAVFEGVTVNFQTDRPAITEITKSHKTFDPHAR